VLYHGFRFVECATATCANGAVEAVPVDRSGEASGRQLGQFALSLSTGQQWMEMSTGKLFELVTIGSSSVDLEACFLSGAGHWLKLTIPITELSDQTKWRFISAQGPGIWSPRAALPGFGRPPRRP
jgi:hypothetical protein